MDMRLLYLMLEQAGENGSQNVAVNDQKLIAMHGNDSVVKHPVTF